MNNIEQIVEIIPLTSLPPQANQKYSYLVPKNMDILPGALVKIPFANRVIDGIVWQKSQSNYSNLKTIINVEYPRIISSKDLEWLEQYSKFSFESLSLLAKSLVLNRKSSVGLSFSDEAKTRKKSSVKIKYTENDLEKTIKTAPAGQILILIPEIIFGVKIIEICKKLERPCFSFNNHLSPNEKNKTISELSRNRSCVIIATHSGIFLPFFNLKTIVLIEPALPSHRQWNMHPYYDARVGAYLKSKLQNIPLIYISTLPSFDILYSQKKKMLSLDFKKITILNKKWDDSNFLSREAINLIRTTTNLGKKVLIYHNAMGYESLYVCRDCGNTLRCDQCDSILQRQARNLFCKKCKLVVGLVRAFCNKCGSPKLNALKTGTRSIEQAMSREFPGLNILRVDKEIGKFDLQTKSLSEADIVIATQMIFSVINCEMFDCCIIPDFSSTLSATNYNALEQSLITLQRLSKLVILSPVPTIFIQDAGSVSNILKYFNSNSILELIKNDLLDRKQLSFPPYSLVMVCEKEFSTEILAKKEISKLKNKIPTNHGDTKIDTVVYKRRSLFVGQITIRDNEPKIREIMKHFSGSWSIDAPRSFSELL